jgi:hypothetical protein
MPNALLTLVLDGGQWSCSSQFIPCESVPSIKLLEGWVGSRVGVDEVAGRHSYPAEYQTLAIHQSVTLMTDIYQQTKYSCSLLNTTSSMNLTYTGRVYVGLSILSGLDYHVPTQCVILEPLTIQTHLK